VGSESLCGLWRDPRTCCKVWQKSISRQDLESYRSQYQVISTKLVGGAPLIHILSDTNPDNGFTSVDPDLEDVFFSRVQQVA